MSAKKTEHGRKAPVPRDAPEAVPVTNLGNPTRLLASVRQGLRSPSARASAPGVSLIDEIVVPVEGTDREFLAQQWAVQLAAALGVVLRGIHIRAPGERDADDLFDYLREETVRWGVPFEREVLEGQDVVAEIVEELGPRDLVVVGTRRLHHRFHMGSVTEDLVRRAPCPVQIVRIE